MAQPTITPNLKLRLSDSLTADARFNLLRIDTLGALLQTNRSQQAVLRSRADVLIEAQSADLGGAGTGGTLTVSGATEVDLGGAALINLTLDGSLIDPVFGNQQISTEDSLLFIRGGWDTLIRPAQSGQTTNLTLTLPPDAGASGYALVTDGAGTLSWEDLSATGQVTGQSVNWTVADGLVKTVTHNWGTLSVLAQVISEVGDTVEVDSTRPNSNQITLTRSSLGAGTWTVLLVRVSV